uniref:Uncharacterized protein n=1 Tax=Meloidogyne hapla TaxID=6305 RepID=A0A1I8C2Q1_MELHA
MFSSWKTILFFAFLLYASSFGLSEGENDKKTENDSGGNNEALPTTPKDTGKEGKTNLTKPENSEQTPVKQSPNNYPNNSISPKENESAYGPNEDFKIFTPLSGISNVSALRQILFKSDPRVNGGKVPIAFQFCPPDNLPKEESKCNGTTGYLVCYVGQLDPKRENGGIAIKYAVGNKNNNSIFNECGKSLEAKSDSKEANKPDYDYWNNAGAKHGILVTYLSGGTFRFSASYDEKVYNYNVGEGNCLLMRLFENDSFLTGVYATGNKASNESIYPNEGKLYNEDFVKFANGLLIEETNLVGPWLLGADVFLRYQDKFHLSTSKNGKEECVPKFSYLYSNYLTQYSDIVLSTDKEG